MVTLFRYFFAYSLSSIRFLSHFHQSDFTPTHKEYITPLIIHSHTAIKRGVAVGNQFRGVENFNNSNSFCGATKKVEPASTTEARSASIFIIRTL